MIRWSFLVVILTFLELPKHCCGQNRTYVESLYAISLNGYNTAIRPNTDQDKPTAVSVQFRMLSVKDFDEISGKFSVVGYFTLYWEDPRITWTASNFDNLTRLYIPQSLVWKPELTLVNAYQYIKAIGFDEIPVKYATDGKGIWRVGEVIDTICDVDVTYFPFDIQKCQLEFAAWGYTSTKLSFTMLDDGINLSEFSENVEWIVTKTEGYTATSRTFSTIIYEVHMERRYVFFIVNVFIPVVFLNLLSNMVFLLPANSGERVGFSITCLLAVAVFLTIVSDTLPKASNPVSVLTFFLMMDFVASAWTCIMTIVGLTLHHKDPAKPVPKWIKLITYIFTCKMCKERKQNKKSKVVPGTSENSNTETEKDLQTDKKSTDTKSYGDIFITNLEVKNEQKPEQQEQVKNNTESKPKNPKIKEKTTKTNSNVNDRGKSGDKVKSEQSSKSTLLSNTETKTEKKDNHKDGKSSAKKSKSVKGEKVIPVKPKVETVDEPKPEEWCTWPVVAKTLDQVCFVFGISVILFLMVVYVMFTNLV